MSKTLNVLRILVICEFVTNFLFCSDSVEKIRITGTDVSAESTVVINANVCYGCAAESCKSLCPRGAVSKSMVNNRAVFIIDPQKCIRCGICIKKCQFGAITWKY